MLTVKGFFLVVDQTLSVVFRKNDETAAALVNTYGGFDEGELYTFSLNADRSFTGNLDGEIQGTWWLSEENRNGTRIIQLFFSYMKDGEQKILSASMELGQQEDEMDVAEYFRAHSLPISLPGHWRVYFQPIAEDSVQGLRDALEHGGKQIVGTWYSAEKSIPSNSNSGYDKAPCTDYTITFSEDGTFTSNLEDLPSGTWTIDNVDHYNEDEYSYHYTLTAEGIGYADIVPSPEGTISIIYNTNSGSHKSFVFTQFSHEQIAQVAEEAIGTWKSYRVYIYDGQGQRIEEDSTEYSITLAADGSFFGNLDGEVAGTWWVVSEWPESDNVVIRYLYDDSRYDERSVASPGTLEMKRVIDENNKYYYLHKVPEE